MKIFQIILNVILAILHTVICGPLSQYTSIYLGGDASLQMMHAEVLIGMAHIAQ